MQTPSFKDIIQNDVKAVFLNPAEFGETHIVNGKRMTVVLDDIENVNREKKMKSHMDGIYARQVFMFVAAEDFGPFPAQGDLVTLDKRRYKVVDATDESGMFALTLEANKSR